MTGMNKCLDEPVEQSAAASRELSLFEALFRQAVDAVLIADHDRRYVDANPAACALIGIDYEKIIGRRVEDFFDLEDNQVVPDAWNTFQVEGTQTGTCIVRRPDGTIRYAGFRARANFLPGLHLSILRDITDQRAAQEALAAKNRELEAANKELARSNAELTHFAHAVGHDLRAPMHTVAWFSQLLVKRAETGSAEMQVFASHINKALERINLFLDDLLAFAQVGRAHQELNLIDSGMVLQWALMNLQAAIQETGAVISHDPLPELAADQPQMVQLFQNLIGNALKYRGNDSPRIHITADKTEDGWLFAISDNGVGVPAEYREAIFGVFKRLHGSDVPGTGLGLALCKRIVENHRGRIWVESQPGKGSTFRFTIPAFA
jgi:PAS domain S-box-containing protein